MAMDGAATAAGFYLGIIDDVSPKLKKLRKEYTTFISDILAGNARVKKSLDSSKRLVQQAAMAQASGGAFANPVAATPVKQKFQLNLEPKRGVGLIRKLFPSAREYMQKFVGRLIPLAKGGVVKDPTAALLGEGGQPEAVIPLSKMQGFFARTLSKAITDAGKMSGAAGGAMGKASNVRDIVLAFTQSEKQVRSLVKFMEDGIASGRDAAADAHRMAVIVAKMRNDEFASSIDKARFIKTLKGELVPAIKKMRDQSGAMRDVLARNDELLQQQKDDVLKLGMLWTAALHNLQQGLDSIGKTVDALSSAEDLKTMMQKGGLSRKEAADATRQFAQRSDGMVSSRNLQSVAAAFSDIGARGQDVVRLTNDFGREITMLSTARGVAEKEATDAVWQVRDRIGYTNDATKSYLASVSALDKANFITSESLLKTTTDIAPLFQGALKSASAEAKSGLVSGVMSAQAALSSQWGNFDVAALFKSLSTDQSARMNVGARLGMSDTDIMATLQSGDFAGIFNKILADIGQRTAGLTGQRLEQEVMSIKGLYGDALSDLDMTSLSTLGAAAGDLTKQLAANVGVTQDAASSMLDLAQDTESVLGPMGWLKNEIRNLADRSGLTTLATMAQEFDLIGIGQGVLGISMAVGGVGGVIGKVLPGIGTLLSKIPLVGVLFKGAAKDTGEAVGSIGKGVGTTIEKVGSGLGSFIGTVGKGIGTAVTGILQGIGAGLLAIAPGLAALAAPPVLIGIGAVSIALVALGGAIWMIGKGLGSAAPFIKASLEGIADLFTAFLPIMQTFSDIIMAQARGIALVIDTTLQGITDSIVQLVTAFSTVDATNLLAVGPGLAAVGIGFAAFGTGLAAGLVALTAGNLVDKIGSFFGLSPGTGVIGALKELTTQVFPLATAFGELSRLPAVISLPELRVPDNYPAEVMSATMRAVPNMQAAAENARYVQQAVGSNSNDEMRDLMRAMLSVLQSIANNGKPRVGGIAGELVAGGIGA